MNNVLDFDSQKTRMALRLPPLSGLRLFEAAPRCGSFKRAAQELNLTPGALSHGVDSLEQWLDVELFERKARGVILTPAGRQPVPVTSGHWLVKPPGIARREIVAFRNWLLKEMSTVELESLFRPCGQSRVVTTTFLANRALASMDLRHRGVPARPFFKQCPFWSLPRSAVAPPLKPHKLVARS